MRKNIVTQQIPNEKIKTLRLEIDGNKKGYEQIIVINDLKIGTHAGNENKGHGIGILKIVLPSSEKPKVFVEYHKRLVSEEVADSLGLEKD